eukprot:CAMPEP_0117684032 /NCGR_PEP_ID=MMETSP0804-20121206/20823_1 /TAXON_ID=1074897 /ORGANISM="Tetraselmis astigmatica, Strain CCMP880" /LENGTH=124 /DNA_ID=CAMNT_0005494877 /DNA_START=42 /DNA_END=412 /DNA_ORIENTATION=+
MPTTGPAKGAGSSYLCKGLLNWRSACVVRGSQGSPRPPAAPPENSPARVRESEQERATFHIERTSGDPAATMVAFVNAEGWWRRTAGQRPSTKPRRRIRAQCPANPGLPPRHKPASSKGSRSTA